MPEIIFRNVPAYRCPTCGYKVNVKPCPRCKVMSRFAVAGSSADHFAAQAAGQARRIVAAVYRAAEREGDV